MFISALLSLALASADTVPAFDPATLYPRLFRVEEVKEADNTGYSLAFDTLPAGDLLAPLVNRNWHYFDYLAEHATTPELTQLVAQRGWQIGPLRAAYDSLLRHDPVYNGVMTTTIGRYLAPRGRTVTEYDPTRPLPRLAMDGVMEVAVRFFYPDEVRPNGTIQTHVCVSLNGMHDLQQPRDLALEAFLYQAIFREANRQSPLRAEWKRFQAEMEAAVVSPDPEVRLTRAREFLWARLASSRVLRATLRRAYEENRDILPFAIAPDTPAAD